MAITRYTASADTTITNGYKPFTNTRSVTANMGAADSLEIYSIYSEVSDPQKSRILINFPINFISESISSGVLPNNCSYFLKLYNVGHTETVPNNYFITIKPISSSWDEGAGLDLDNYTDIGQSGSTGVGANWIFRTRSEPQLSWSQSGGDFFDQYSVDHYVKDGNEDIEIDVTNIVNLQINGTLPKNGFSVALSSSYEDGTLQKTLYTKRFSARSTEYFYKKPLLEARWDSSVKDNRKNFYFISNNLSDIDNTQDIYFYNRVNGVLANVYNNPQIKVKVINDFGTSVSSEVTAINVQPGVYKASLAITGSVSQELTDVWYSGSKSYYSGSINALVRNEQDDIYNNEFVFSITNLKKSYKTYENPKIKIFSRIKNWSPNIYKIAFSDVESLKLDNLYYKIVRITDNLTIIDYGDGNIPYTKCSYDSEGNYFNLDMSIFEPGYTYGIKLMLKVDNFVQEYPNVFKLKVE